MLEGGIRIITQRGFNVALGRHKNPTTGQRTAGKPGFLSAKRLEPFISPDLERSSEPILFHSRGGYRGNIGFGYLAELLPLVCSTFVDPDDAGALPKSEANKRTVQRARQLLRAFATVGIIALVDEATGYQEDRDRDELQRILAAYISPALMPWTRRFPEAFYQEMFRLWGWTHRPKRPQYRPLLAGKLTKQFIYEQLPPGVCEELERLNPPNEKGHRKRKHFQFLTKRDWEPASREAGRGRLGPHGDFPEPEDLSTQLRPCVPRWPATARTSSR